MARLVVAVAAAAIVGFTSENPVWAAQTFAFVYGATGFLDPNSKVLGPKLLDLTAPQADFGQPIFYVKGTIRVPGNVIYSSDKYPVESTTTTDGKGGPGVDTTTTTYKIDMLIKVSCNELAALRRAFSNGKLKWSNADTADGETLAASALANDWDELRFYGGGPDQMPDPDYEIAVGAGNAPAYRSSATIFVKGCNLGTSGQLPVLTWEVTSESGASATAGDLVDVPATYIIGQGASPFSLNGFEVHIGQWDNSYANTTVNVYAVDAAGGVTLNNNYEASSNAPSAHGQTDVAGIMGAGGNLLGGFDPYKIYWNEISSISNLGISFSFNIPGTEPFNAGGALGSQQVRFCMHGDVVCFASTNFGSGIIRRYSKSDAAFGGLGADPLAASAATSYKDALATDGTLLYALQYQGTAIEVFDLATMTLQTTLTGPGGTSGQSCSILVDENGQLFFLNGFNFNIYSWNGASWDIAYPAVFPGYVTTGAQYGIDNGVVFLMSNAGTGGAPVQRIRFYIATVTQSGIGLDDLVLDLAARTRLIDPSQMDVTELASDTVRGIAVTQVVPTRSLYETLGGAFFFEMFESGTKVVCRKRGGPAVRTITFDELGISSDGSEEPFIRRRLNDIEYPKQIVVRFSNALNDYQPDAQMGDRLVTPSTSIQMVELPIVFTPSEGKKIADVATTDLQNSLIVIGPLKTTKKHLDLEPGDVVNVVDHAGNRFRARTAQVEVTNFEPTLNLILDDATSVNSNVATDSDYDSVNLISLRAATELEMIDGPLLRDIDDGLGPYAAVDADGPWAGAAIYKSVDGTTFGHVGEITSRTVIGVATTTLGNFTGGWVFDAGNSITVNVGAEDTLSSYTRADAVAGTAQLYLIGSELIYACTATYVSQGVYILSNLLRGLLGTEWAIPGHVASERVVLIQTSGLRKLVDDATDINISRSYKAVTLGSSVVAVSAEGFTDTGVIKKPYAPMDLHVDWTVPAAPVIDWNRRSRYKSLLFGVPPPLGETLEAYDVEHTSGATLVEGITVSSASYTPANTPAPGDVITVWQKSATIGRGYPASLEL